MEEFSDLTFKNGIKDGFPIGLGYLSVSIAFGVKASLLGIPVFITLLISLTNLTSAGQLAGLDVIASMGSLLEIVLIQLVINARYFLMSISLSQKLDSSFKTFDRFFCATFVTDEIFAVAVSKPKNFSKRYFLGLSFLPYIGWAIGTFIGAIAGNVLPAVITSALGIALYAMFIAIILPPAMKELGVLIVIILSVSLSCAMFYLPIFSAITYGFKIIICALVSSAIIAYFFPIKEKEGEENVNG